MVRGSDLPELCRKLRAVVYSTKGDERVERTAVKLRRTVQQKQISASCNNLRMSLARFLKGIFTAIMAQSKGPLSIDDLPLLSSLASQKMANVV